MTGIKVFVSRAEETAAKVPPRFFYRGGSVADHQMAIAR